MTKIFFQQEKNASIKSKYKVEQQRGSRELVRYNMRMGGGLTRTGTAQKRKEGKIKPSRKKASLRAQGRIDAEENKHANKLGTQKQTKKF